MKLACLKQNAYPRRRPSSAHILFTTYSHYIPELSWVPFSLTIKSSLTQKSLSPWPFLIIPNITLSVEIPTSKINLKVLITSLLLHCPCRPYPHPFTYSIQIFHYATPLFIVTTTMNRSSTSFHQTLPLDNCLPFIITAYNYQWHWVHWPLTRDTRNSNLPLTAQPATATTKSFT